MTIKKRNLEALAILAGLFFVVITMSWIVNTYDLLQLHPNVETRPSCYDIKANEKWYIESGRSEWVRDCKAGLAE